MRTARFLRRFGSARAGNAAVEFALIAPILLLMAAGVFEVSRAFQSLSAVNKLASQYAIVWADCPDLPVGLCNTEIATYTPSASLTNLAPQLTSTVTLQMFQVKMSGTTPNVTYSYPIASSLTPAQTAAAQAVLTNGQSGVIVTVSYVYAVSIFPSALVGIVPSTIPMSYTVAQLKA